ncbi:hypothetical protein [Microbacterium sp. LWH3-1.2]|uniref:hypothetical protein n=1 Tax=Microbacterium sp. LWH3-1.2 TaxID=3135256 RepID=UPI003415CEA1
MKTPSTRIRTIAALAAGPVAVLIAGGMVWQGSQAAFTATTRNAGNSWTTGSVFLTDDDLGAAAFNVENLVPGQTGQKCIVVTSNATVPGEVRLYSDNLLSANGLEDRIFLQVEQGTGGSFNDCTGFSAAGAAIADQPLSTLATTHADYATGGAAWQTAGTDGETRSYRASWRFDTTGMTQAQIDALQGASVGIDLVWELQSDE